VKVPEALEFLTAEEANRLVDMEVVAKEAVRRVEQSGIVFLDEIDKIAGRETRSAPTCRAKACSAICCRSSRLDRQHQARHGADDHILFIASGAFHVAKPSDLIPEFQGRFPIRVELDALTRDDFVRILTEPRNALLKQYVALMATENVSLRFTDEAVGEIARIAATVNELFEDRMQAAGADDSRCARSPSRRYARSRRRPRR